MKNPRFSKELIAATFVPVTFFVLGLIDSYCDGFGGYLFGEPISLLQPFCTFYEAHRFVGIGAYGVIFCLGISVITFILKLFFQRFAYLGRSSLYFFISAIVIFFMTMFFAVLFEYKLSLNH